MILVRVPDDVDLVPELVLDDLWIAQLLNRTESRLTLDSLKVTVEHL